MKPLTFYSEDEVLGIILNYKKIIHRALIISCLKNGHLAPLKNFVDEERRLMAGAAK